MTIAEAKKTIQEYSTNAYGDLKEALDIAFACMDKCNMGWILGQLLERIEELERKVK